MDESHLIPFQIDAEKHLKILRYMKKRYPTTFEEVKSNIYNTLEAK